MAGERHPLSPITEVRGSFTCGPEHPRNLGFQFYYTGDAVECEWTASEAVQGWRGLLHGSAFAALHDDAAAYAMVVLAARTGFTARMDIRFLRPIRIGETVKVVGKVHELGDRRGTFATEIRLAHGDVASTAMTEYALVDPKTLAAVLGRPLSPAMQEWLTKDDAGRRAMVLEWGRRHAGELGPTR